MNTPVKQPTTKCPWFGDCPPRYVGDPLPQTAVRCGMCGAAIVAPHLRRFL